MATHKNPKTSPNTAITTTSEIIANNDDLLIEILVKLPLKSLIKFKSVSKHWLSLISDPEFSRRRDPFPSSVSGLFLKRQSSSSISNFPEFDFVDLNQSSNPSNAPIRSFTFITNPSGIDLSTSSPTLHHSCNGLLLFSTDAREIFVYNPTTKKYTVLPPQLPPEFVFGLSLAFDPSKSPHYKVVCVLNCDPFDDQCQIHIYSSKTGNWRLSGDSFYADETMGFESGVFWNGAVHWLCIYEPSSYFNVDEERLSVMPLPPVPEDWVYDKNFNYFGESQGHLHFIDHLYDPTTPHFDVYEMEMNYSGWFVKFRIDCSEFPTAFPEIIPNNRYHKNLNDCDFFIVYIDRRCDADEESYAVIRIPGKVVRYNFKSKTFHKLCDIEPDIRPDSLVYFVGSLDVHQYIESLALV